MTFELQAKAAGISIVAPEFLAALPYLATILVLALISMRQLGRRRGAGLPRPPVQTDCLKPTRETEDMTLITRRSLLGAGGAAAALPLLGGRAFAQDPLKVGFVYLGPIGDFGWTYAHEQGRQQAIAEFGDAIETTIVENVAEGPDSERVIRNLAEDGNKLIFTTSFGYMNPTIKVAQALPGREVRALRPATSAPTTSRPTTPASTRAARSAARSPGTCRRPGSPGYIASFPIPEVVMGINAFTLAARKVNPDFKTNVVWVSTWYDPAKEADAAKALFDQGADIIAQHTDSPAALQAAEQRGLMAFGQAWNMSSFAPKAHLTAIENHWGVYYVDRIRKMLDGNWDVGATPGGASRRASCR